jgi:hypothetical protein
MERRTLQIGVRQAFSEQMDKESGDLFSWGEGVPAVPGLGRAGTLVQ